MKQHGDRFIPRRNSRSHPYHALMQTYAKGVDILSQRSTDAFRHAHRKRLETVWGLRSVHERVFLFSNANNIGKNQNIPSLSRKQDWPIKARKKPTITSPEMILDLPDFSGSFYQTLLDWGSNGLFAAALKDQVYLWNADSRATTVLTRIDDGICTAVKWNLKGNLLAIGRSVSHIQAWDPVDKKLVFESWCACTAVSDCEITTLDWDPVNAVIISGCSKGTLCQITKIGDTITKRDIMDAHTGKIALVRTSSDAKHMASCGEDGFVRVWLWRQLEFIFQINLHFPCRSLAWHPWQPSILAMGALSVSVWNVKKRCMDAWHAPKIPASISAITFSSITGEMVVSFWVLQPGSTLSNQVSSSSGEAIDRAINLGTNSSARTPGKYRCQLMVLGSLDHVVDWLVMDVNSSCATFYLLWSPDGKKLATAGSDDALLVWNFLGEDDREKSAKKEKNILQDSYGFCIR